MKKTVYAIECVTIPISDEQRYWGCSGLDEFTDIINCSFWTNKENAKEDKAKSPQTTKGIKHKAVSTRHLSMMCTLKLFGS